MRRIDIEKHDWWTACTNCDRRYIVHDIKPIESPDEADEFGLTCICGEDVRGWNQGGQGCPHDSWSGDEGPVALLGRMPVRWRCDGCGLVRVDEEAP